jgi:Na+-driven multidrug efflux pump
MKINLALWDRILRIVMGTILSTWAVAGGPWWSFFGVYLIMTASWGLCPIYGILKFRTYHDKGQTRRRETL